MVPLVLVSSSGPVVGAGPVLVEVFGGSPVVVGVSVVAVVVGSPVEAVEVVVLAGVSVVDPSPVDGPHAESRAQTRPSGR